MNRNFLTFIAVCAAGAFALVLLATWQFTPRIGEVPADPMVLRVHAVPPARAEGIREALTLSLMGGPGEAPMGRVATTGLPGQLLVLAPARIQTGIGDAIATLGAGAPAADASDSVTLDLWSIVAVPGEGADDPTLAPLAAALDAARPALGRVRFEQGDALSVTALAANEPFDARTPGGFAVNGVLNRAESGVTARLGVSNPALSTTLQLRFGEALVVARVPDGDSRIRVLVARARPVDARG
ncbi:MAG: hypothetical protein ACK59M_07705 [Pseudomonadota bacterium]|jgi:hypothetical protein